MKRGLREIVSPTEKAALPAVLAAWGYVRPTQPGEIEHGLWFAHGDDGLFWLIRDGAWQAADEAQLHLCAAPRAQGRIASRWALTAIEVVASLVGLRVLHAPVRPEWEPLLRRFGWEDAPEARGGLGPYATGWMKRCLGPWPPIWTPEAAEIEARLAEEAASRKDAAHGASSAASVSHGSGLGPHDQRLAE